MEQDGFAEAILQAAPALLLSNFVVAADEAGGNPLNKWCHSSQNAAALAEVARQVCAARRKLRSRVPLRSLCRGATATLEASAKPAPLLPATGEVFSHHAKTAAWRRVSALNKK